MAFYFWPHCAIRTCIDVGPYMKAHARLAMMVTYGREDRPLYSGQP